MPERSPADDPRQRILKAGERLFARDGIVGARARDIAALAGQQNPSALHYHFGSRQGLVAEILNRYAAEIDEREAELLADREAAGPIELVDVLEAVVRARVEALDTERGRDCSRIVPQMLHLVSTNLRRGVAQPTTEESRRILELLDGCLTDLPIEIRTERLIAYSITLMSLIAERAYQVESGEAQVIDSEQFQEQLVTMLQAMLTAPVVAVSSEGRRS